jgi:hypothetical protein
MGGKADLSGILAKLGKGGKGGKGGSPDFAALLGKLGKGGKGGDMAGMSKTCSNIILGRLTLTVIRPRLDRKERYGRSLLLSNCLSSFWAKDFMNILCR